MGSRTLHPVTTAEAYLELLDDRGIDVFLGNAGTDFALARRGVRAREAEGGRAPRPLVIPHEFVAVSMAHGYYAAGRPARRGDGPRQRRHRECVDGDHHRRAGQRPHPDVRRAHAGHRGGAAGLA